MKRPVLTPQLTPLDRRILGELDDRTGQRPRRIASRASTPKTPVSPSQVREILRGLEQIGVAHTKGGWWRKTPYPA